MTATCSSSRLWRHPPTWGNNVLASEIISPARVLGKDPAPGTYSDATLLAQLDMICIDIMNRVRFPYARISTATVAGQQEYQLPETPIDDGMGCVYLNGQLLSKTEVSELQGQQIGYFDQSGFGTQSAGSGGPTANAGAFVPAWTVQPPESFPVPNYQTLRTMSAPWVSGSAPKYYLRGGSIGIVPAPNASAKVVNGVPVPNLVIDLCITNAYLGPYTWNGTMSIPPALTATGQRIWYPSNFKPALMWSLVEIIGAADDTGMTKEARDNAAAKARDQVNQLMFWATGLRSNNRINYQTNRARYAGYSWRRNTQTGGGYP